MDSREPPAAPPLQSHLQQQHPPPGMMLGPPPNSYAHATSMNHNNPTISPANTMQNPSFPFNSVTSTAPQPLDHPNYGDGSSPSLRPVGAFSIDPTKKKRGRPRKYSPDNNNISLGLTTPTPITPISSSMAYDESGDGAHSGEPSAKKTRGRPPGSGKKQMDALGSAGVSFTPHVIIVNAGEDIASKLVAFSQQGPRTICILSANGAVCNVTLRQPAMSGGTVTYEGRFEIISLSGSFMTSESNANHNRAGGLSVSLAGSDGRVLGGGVAGMLVAATPVQVIVGSFIANGKKSKSGPMSDPHSNMLNFGPPIAPASPPSQGGSSESSDENGNSPLHHGSGPYGNANQPIHDIYTSMGWANSMKILPN